MQTFTAPIFIWINHVQIVPFDPRWTHNFPINTVLLACLLPADIIALLLVAQSLENLSEIA